MLSTITWSLALLTAAGQTTYKNDLLDVTFQHPDSWKVVNKKGDSKVTIPLADGTSAALAIFPRSFNASIDIWQAVEKDMAKQLKRTIVNQWQEELMGVPLLLTKTKYTERGSPMMSLSGMVYSATANKLVFRLTSAEGSYDECERAWRGAMQTMRTASGKLPTPEDPGRTVTPEEVKRANEKPPTVTPLTGPKVKPPKQLKGEVVIAAKAGGRAVALRVPNGWTGTLESDGSVTLRNTQLSQPLRVEVFSTLDSDAPNRALIRLAAKSLDVFATLTGREEPPVRENLAGAVVDAIWRDGKAAGGPLASCDAVGTLGDNYWLFDYRWNPAPKGSTDHKALLDLISRMSVEPAS